MKKVSAVVIKDRCHPHKCQHECMKYDPINRSGGEGFHISEITGKAEIAEEVVSEIHRVSASKCPFSAIKIIRLPQKLNENPIHKFGVNSFELFRLPMLKKGSIVGVLGRNGIGKSTALEILSGTIKPNLGNWKKQPKDEEIIQAYSHTYLGNYFKDLFDGKIRIAYKPQRIELLPKIFKGKIVDLIEKVDEKNIGLELIKDFGLEKIKTREIKNLSGGELQKVAIIASLIKDADVVYLDEPASFLDVHTRIKVARKIMELSKNSSVIVVEHDLATLDYTSDEIQIIYGEQAAYGILSQSKAVKRGINEYLDGYLPDENVRFRDYEIRFLEPQKNLNKQPETLLKVPEFKKTFDWFKLKSNACELKKGEVLAVMGANGLGKTTFLKILAGLENPDNKVKMENVRIAYKTQYPKPIDGTVKEHLKKLAGSLFSSGWYQQNILEKLNLEHLQNNHIETLSGGELQKVYIAATLSTDAPILAFDEPSAFIDVEDRLKVAEVIKEFVAKKEVSAIVVDHDVQFIDYVGDRMLVFEGVPGNEGNVYGPCSKEEGMNRVLKALDITYRKDDETNRPRINKPNSQLDTQQREKGQYYYSS